MSGSVLISGVVMQCPDERTHPHFRGIPLDGCHHTGVVSTMKQRTVIHVYCQPSVDPV